MSNSNYIASRRSNKNCWRGYKSSKILICRPLKKVAKNDSTVFLVPKNDSTVFLVPKNGLFNKILSNKIEKISQMNELLQNKIPIRAAQNK